MCAATAAWLHTHTAVRPVAWQSLDLTAVGLTEADVMTAAYLVNDGHTLRGHSAISGALRLAHKRRWRAAGAILGLHWIQPLAAAGYAVVAAHRHRFPGRACATSIPRVDAGADVTERLRT